MTNILNASIQPFIFTKRKINIIQLSMNTMPLLQNSAPTMSIPGISSTWKEYSWTTTVHLKIAILLSGILQVLQNLWSVWSVNLLPARYNLNLLIPYTTVAQPPSQPWMHLPILQMDPKDLEALTLAPAAGILLIRSTCVPVPRITGYVQLTLL